MSVACCPQQAPGEMHRLSAESTQHPANKPNHTSQVQPRRKNKQNNETHSEIRTASFICLSEFEVMTPGCRDQHQPGHDLSIY